MNVFEKIAKAYNTALEHGDKRVKDYPLMGTPFLTNVITLIYVILVLTSKKWMSKEPYNIRPVMVIYNFGMVIYSGYLVYEFCAAGWLTGYTLGCQPVDYSTSPKAMRMVRVCYLYYLAKYIEFIDTFFFILRRRFELVTVLHVYHHAILPTGYWWGMNFAPGGFGSFSVLVNSIVHMVMYFYYGISALGPHMRPYLWWKKYLTKLQILQFIVVMAHCMQLYFIDCDYPLYFVTALIFFAFIFLLLFLNFYVHSYLKTHPKANKIAVGSQTLKHD